MVGSLSEYVLLVMRSRTSGVYVMVMPRLSGLAGQDAVRVVPVGDGARLGILGCEEPGERVVGEAAHPPWACGIVRTG
jgi:hypothetical protein